MNITKELVTPVKAREYLEASGGNRSLKRNLIERLKSLINVGEWHGEISPIIFNSDGELIDGHHRLTAVYESGQSVEMIVLRDIQRTAQKYIDTGKPRNYADTLHFRGVKNARYAEACLRIIVELIDKNRNVTTHDLDRLYNLFSGLIVGKGVAYIQFPLSIAEKVFGISKEIIKEVKTGYNVQKGSLSDKIRKIQSTPKTNDSRYRFSVAWEVLEVCWRASKGMPFKNITYGDETVRNEIRNALIDWATNPLADRG